MNYLLTHSSYKNFTTLNCKLSHYFYKFNKLLSLLTEFLNENLVEKITFVSLKTILFYDTENNGLCITYIDFKD